MKLKILAILIATVYTFGANITLSGSVISDNQKMLTSRNMGYVKKMLVSEGDFVKKGQLLYVIDSTENNSAITMQRNQLSNIETNLARHERLYKKGMVSKYDLENLRLAAKNQREMVRIAETQDNYLQVRAPNDGIIVAKKLNQGEMAAPGMPALILTDMSRLRIMAEISESNLKNIKIGQSVKVEVPSAGLKTTGIVSSIIPASNPMTHKFTIKIKFDRGSVIVYPGMYARVNISI
ncbi:MAG: efflux RND transporter periplasmic adaptor subunit [Epsilonproteobacteria bacterium]|nr:efflux RND transporter periplasmic adaptor subunit [Campylobacterota bacterium]